MGQKITTGDLVIITQVPLHSISNILLNPYQEEEDPVRITRVQITRVIITPSWDRSRSNLDRGKSGDNNPDLN